MLPIGKGTFRLVYSHPKNTQGQVIKIPRSGVESFGRVMNQEEIQASQKFPNLFPAVYNNNLDALIVDRASMFQDSPSDIIQFFSSLQSVVRVGKVSDPWKLLRVIIGFLTGKKSTLNVQKEFEVTPKMLVRFAQKDTLATTLADAVKKLGIDINDIRKENCGVSRRTGEFVLVDASTMVGFQG